MITEYLSNFTKSNPIEFLVIFGVLILISTEVIYFLLLRSKKRYNQSTTQFSIELKLASIFMSLVGFLGLIVIGEIIEWTVHNIISIAIFVLIVVTVIGYFWTNKLVADKYSKQITFKKGEKLIANQDFDGNNSLIEGEIVTYIGKSRSNSDAIKIMKKSGKIQENKYYRFDKKN